MDYIEEVLKANGKKIIERKAFPLENGDQAFSGYYRAADWLNAQGYTVGTMCGDMPIAAAKGYEYIAKWRNIPVGDYCLIEAVIISPDFRNCEAEVVIFGS